MNIKLGIIGFGGMGEWHSRNAIRAEGVEIIAACDIKAERLDLIKERGYTCYDSVDELLKDDKINTVLLTVPNHLHKEMAIKAANAGKHIICEKPAALNAIEFDEMVKAAQDKNVLFTVHQNRRWDKDFQIVKKAYEDNMLGNVFKIESSLLSANGLMHEWHIYKKYGGGILYDWGVHKLDQVLYLMKGHKIISVYADIKNVLHEEVDDYFEILLKFDNGITASFQIGTYILKQKPRWFVAGDRGTLYIDNFECDGAIIRTSKKLDKLPAAITETVAGPTRQFAPTPAGVLYEDPLPEVETDWVDFYRNFTDVMNGKAEFKIKDSEVRRVLALMEAARQSSETNESVMFES